MSVEKIKDKIKNEVDEYFKSKECTAISKEEMVEEISNILKKYIDIPKIEVEVEIVSDGMYPVVKYKTRSYMNDIL